MEMSYIDITKRISGDLRKLRQCRKGLHGLGDVLAPFPQIA